jgi:hypothetical protein
MGIKMELSFDGLLKVAEKHGLTGYETSIGPGANGLTCLARLRWGRDKTWDEQRLWQTLQDAKDDGTGTSRIWELYPERMLVRFTVSKAIRIWLKDQLAELEV